MRRTKRTPQKSTATPAAAAPMGRNNGTEREFVLVNPRRERMALQQPQAQGNQAAAAVAPMAPPPPRPPSIVYAVAPPLNSGPPPVHMHAPVAPPLTLTATKSKSGSSQDVEKRFKKLKVHDDDRGSSLQSTSRAGQSTSATAAKTKYYFARKTEQPGSTPPAGVPDGKGDALPTPPPAKVARKQKQRVYYHSRTCTPIEPHEFDHDSEGDEADLSWMQELMARRINQLSYPSKGEKEMMILWNIHMTTHKFLGKVHALLAAEMFVDEQGDEIYRRNLFDYFVSHLNVMYKYGILSAASVHDVIHRLLDKKPKAQEVAEKGKNKKAGECSKSLPPQNVVEENPPAAGTEMVEGNNQGEPIVVEKVAENICAGAGAGALSGESSTSSKPNEREPEAHPPAAAAGAEMLDVEIEEEPIDFDELIEEICNSALSDESSTLSSENEPEANPPAAAAAVEMVQEIKVEPVDVEQVDPPAAAAADVDGGVPNANAVADVEDDDNFDAWLMLSCISPAAIARLAELTDGSDESISASSKSSTDSSETSETDDSDDQEEEGDENKQQKDGEGDEESLMKN